MLGRMVTGPLACTGLLGAAAAGTQAVAPAVGQQPTCPPQRGVTVWLLGGAALGAALTYFAEVWKPKLGVDVKPGERKQGKAKTR
jgi:hypothetical protein